MNKTELAIDVKNLSKKFGNKVVVNHIDVQVPKGQIIGFLGPNGSGKTTTIRMICGLLTPTTGAGTCMGMDIRTKADEIRKKVGYMTQKFSFWEDLSIRENLEFVARVFGMDNIKERVDNALKNLGLAQRQEQLAGTLSGGWKQRLALAACILHEPEILLLDEPTAGVDPKARREFWDELRNLSEKGITILVSTHYMDEAERCHSIIYIAYGDIMVKGTVQEVIDSTKLVTYSISGDDIMGVMDKIKGNPEIVTMAPYGDQLRISGSDKYKLEHLLNKSTKDKITQAEPSLEDAFIFYMTKSAKEEENG
ncbi:MAG: ABC transporter ATP-binding protein [Lactobacillaceae bacterium]|jgi:ABC-2 type transport system ATP-binding protein|nr:ABC transporter ATP-binding protein [Lactobacillaceae bacterium]